MSPRFHAITWDMSGLVPHPWRKSPHSNQARHTGMCKSISLRWPILHGQKISRNPRHDRTWDKHGHQPWQTSLSHSDRLVRSSRSCEIISNDHKKCFLHLNRLMQHSQLFLTALLRGPFFAVDFAPTAAPRIQTRRTATMIACVLERIFSASNEGTAQVLGWMGSSRFRDVIRTGASGGLSVYCSNENFHQYWTSGTVRDRRCGRNVKLSRRTSC